MLLFKSLDITYQSYHDYQSIAGQFHQIIQLFQHFPQDEVVIVDHLNFSQVSAMINPGQGRFVFSGF